MLAKECFNVVNLPLFKESEETLVLQKCLVPELHLMQGFVNYLFWVGIVPIIGRDQALTWPIKLNVISKDYHGNIFEGNACKTLLQNSDLLLSKDVLQEKNPLALVPFVSAFKAMNCVVENCFSTKKVIKNLLKTQIQTLKKAFTATELPQTLKIHIILNHIEDCLKFLAYDGLGTWSEQAGESVHREFVKYWDKYKINSVDNTSFGKHLKKAVVDFSSTNL